MASNKAHRLGKATLCEWKARIRSTCRSCCYPWHYIVRNALAAQPSNFFAAAAKNHWVAAFQAHHLLAFGRMGRQNTVDLFLAYAHLAWAFRYIHKGGIAPRITENAFVN